MGDWRLTGRDDELRLLTGALDAKATSGGVVIAGGAGVGKTRLAREALAAAAERGWVTRSVQGTAAARAVPLGAFAQWVDQRDDQPLALVGSVITAVTASTDGAPVLVVVDDAHLIDDLSAFVLHQLVRRRKATVIATLRTGEGVPETVTALWKDGHLQRLDLQPLTRQQCTQLLETVLGDRIEDDSAAHLWELTAGNVLFMRELVKQELDGGRLIRNDEDRWQWTGLSAVSPTLNELVDTYIGAVPEEVLEVLDLVAVAEPLELEHLVALTDPAAIEDAERRELITVSSEADALVRLEQPLYGETRRDRMGRMRARRLCGRIAHAISKPGTAAAGVDPVRLALLWLESDLPADADVCDRGAAAAFRRLDLPLSARLAEAAARAGAGTETPSRILHARALSMLGRGEEAEQLLAAWPASEKPDADWVEAKVLRALNLLLMLGRPDQSWTVIEDALSEVPPELLDQELLAFRALQLALDGRPAEVVALLDALDPIQLSPESRVNLNYGTTLAFGELGKAEQATQTPDDTLVLATDALANPFQAAWLALMHVDALTMSGHIAEAVSLGERVMRQWAELPDIPRVISAAVAGVAAVAHGDLRTARENLGAAMTTEVFRDDEAGLAFLGIGYWLGIAYTEALARSGDADAAATALGEMERHRHPSLAFLEPNRMLAQAWVAAARGRATEAITLVAEAAEVARGRGQHAREVLCLQTATQFGDNRHSERLAELATLVEGPRAGIAARWADALKHNDGDGLLEVSGDLEAMGDRVGAADAAAQAAGVFDRLNLRGSKLTASGRATRIAAECGSTTPATRDISAPLPLSRREREIATLVRDGLSNKEIAETLTMSVRTVEGHIYRACNKVGVANRAELGELINQFTQ